MKLRFDWLTFTIPEAAMEGFNGLSWLVSSLFPFRYDVFTPCFGRYGYRKGSFYKYITILEDGTRDFMGTCFDISGQGMMFLYSLKGFSFEELFKKINSLGGSISRLDVALDCFDHELDYDEITDAIKKHNYATRWHQVKIIDSFKGGVNGRDFQFGSRRSDAMLRIYDKKAESGSDEHDYWCRVEFQFRHDMAHAFADTFLNKDEDRDFIELFLGVLCNYLRFIERKYKNDADKCPTLDWWDRFIGHVAKS